MSGVDTYYRDLKDCEDYETYKHLLPIPYPNDTEEVVKLKEFFESGEKNKNEVSDTKRTETN